MEKEIKGESWKGKRKVLGSEKGRTFGLLDPEELRKEAERKEKKGEREKRAKSKPKTTLF